MPWAIIRVTPVDYDAWHELHTSQIENLKTHGGVLSEVLCRDHDDPRTVMIIQEIEDVGKLQAFFGSPEMQELIASAPVEGPPTFYFLDEQERPI